MGTTTTNDEIGIAAEAGGAPAVSRRVGVALIALPLLGLAIGFLIGIRAVGNRAVPAADKPPVERDLALRLVGIGLGFHQGGKLDLAEALYREAVAADPSLGMAYYDLGCVANDRHNLDEAEHWFREALRVDPGDERAKGNLTWVMGQKSAGPAAGPGPAAGR